jgi:hypothetical protein
MVTFPRSRSMSYQRRAHSSPRRQPVTMTVHKSAPHAGVFQDSLRMAAASASFGGSGARFLAAGGLASSAGFTLKYFQRTPRYPAPASTARICRTLLAASGAQT